MTEKHNFMPTQLINDLCDLSEHSDETLKISEFEKSLVNDRLQAIKEYGNNAVVTEKQLKILNSIIEKHKINKRAKGIRLLK